MNIDQATHKIRDVGIIPVVRAANVAEARAAIDAITTGGIPVIEVTMTIPNAVAIIRELTSKNDGNALIGAGTVVTAAQAEACLDAGAEFLVSPGLSLPVMKVAAARQKLVMPGALTPTEVIAALDAGATLIKVFPCGAMGGPKYIKSLRAPFPDVRFIPTGGVNLSNAAEFIAAGSFALGVGADLVDLAALRRNEAHKITAMAKALCEAVCNARASSAKA